MIVKIQNLKVEGLYGQYSYSISFNPDVTFIYGENGCGKTTILNITEAIITGALYKLFQYKFSRIVLSYSSDSSLEKAQQIIIRLLRKNFAVVFNGEEYTLKRDAYDRWSFSGRGATRINDYYFSNNQFLGAIKDTFNYVYLPLNRSQNRKYDTNVNETGFIRNMRIHQVYAFSDDEDDNEAGYLSSIEQAIELIRKNQMWINSQIRKINDSFRNKILKALLESNASTEKEGLVALIHESETKEQLERIRDTYIAIMQEIVSVSLREVRTYRKYFDDFIEKYLSYKSEEPRNAIPVDLLLQYQNVKKTERLIKIAEEAEAQKREVQKPLELFLSTMNEFIGNGEEKKQLRVDPEGNIYMITSHKDERIRLQYMSSGEKQLLTFFAHLIFGVRRGQPGIFVVDEPELSLHLSWQKMFVEKALAVNSNIQLIFATHSPEIIGRYRSKMFKLTKEHVSEKSE